MLIQTRKKNLLISIAIGAMLLGLTGLVISEKIFNKAKALEQPQTLVEQIREASYLSATLILEKEHRLLQKQRSPQIDERLHTNTIALIALHEKLTHALQGLPAKGNKGTAIRLITTKNADLNKQADTYATAIHRYLALDSDHEPSTHTVPEEHLQALTATTLIQLQKTHASSLQHIESALLAQKTATRKKASRYRLSTLFLSIGILFVTAIPILTISYTTMNKRARFALQLIDEMHQGIIVFDNNDRVVYISERVGKLLEMPDHWNPTGRLRSEIIEEAVKRGDYGDVDNADDSYTQIDHIEKHRDRSTPSGRQIRLNFKDVQRQQIVTYTDVTDLKLREQALSIASETQRKLSLIAKHTQDFITIYDANFHVEWVNPAYEAHSGYSFSELVGNASKNLPSVTLEDGQPLIEFLKEGNAYRGEIQLQKKNGERYWCESSIQPVIEMDGQITQFIIVSRDTSERVENQIQLRERERAAKRLARALEETVDAIAIVNRQGVCQWANAAFFCSTGYGKEFEGKEVFTLLQGPQTSASTVESVKQAILSGEQLQFETTAYRRDGSAHEVAIACNPIFDEDDNASEVIYIQRDISARKERENLLREARTQAEKASIAKSEFLANMSHEIRTPMNGIVGMSQLLLDSDLSDAEKSLVRVIVQSGSTLLTIINDILDFSKVEAGKFSLEYAPFNLDETLKDIMALTRPQDPKHRVALHYNYTKGLESTFVGDEVRIRQIVTNLLGNALKFTEEGTVSFNVHGKARGPDRSILYLDIADTGVGIPKNQQESIFSAFEQAENGTARRYGGTGLGLSISKRFAQLMGGDITVTSELGHGSTFRFSLPLNHGLCVAAPHKRQCHRPSSINKNLCILIAEDNSTNLLVLRKMLEHIGYTNLNTVGNGLEAVEKYIELTPSIVLMDWFMPELDGLAATKEIRHLEATHNLKRCPIVALTASAMEGDDKKCIAAGMEAYISKPIDRQKLAETIERLMSQPTQ